MNQTIKTWCERYKKGHTPSRHISFECDQCGDNSDWELGTWKTSTSVGVLSGLISTVFTAPDEQCSISGDNGP